MKAMTLGFIFDPTLTEVLLIKKNRPEWQKGLHNGVGGHAGEIETKFENWAGCFAREAQEETNLQIFTDRLIKIGRIHGQYKEEPILVVMFAYRLQDAKEMKQVDTITDEELVWVPVEDIGLIPLIENLTFIIPFARYRLKYKHVQPGSLIDLAYG